MTMGYRPQAASYISTRKASMMSAVIATAMPIGVAIGAMFLLGEIGKAYADVEHEMPRLSAWLLERRWVIPIMLAPAMLCGIALALVRRRYMVYAPYLFCLLVPLIVIVAAVAWLILSVYAEVLDGAA